MKRFCVTGLILVSAAMVLAGADFTYEEKTEITGGSMKRMIDMAARFSRKPAGPQVNTHYISGDRMAVVSGQDTTIYDLGAGTLTQIDAAKKEYSVLTFAEMTAALERMMARMGQAQQQQQQPKVNWRASSELTGKTKPVVGVETKEALLRVEAEAQDTASGEKAGITNMEMDMWIGAIPGYEAVRDFQKKLASQFAAGANMSPMLAAQMGSNGLSAMAEAGKKLSELNGIPLETTLRMKGLMGMPQMPQLSRGGSGDGANGPSAGDIAGQAANQAAADAARQAGSAAGSRAGGRLGGIGGGLGGSMGGMLGGRLGRKKPKEEPATAPAPETTQAAAPAAPAGDPVALETVTVVTSFNTNPVNAAVFAVPAGFKKVESPMEKMK